MHDVTTDNGCCSNVAKKIATTATKNRSFPCIHAHQLPFRDRCIFRQCKKSGLYPCFFWEKKSAAREKKGNEFKLGREPFQVSWCGGGEGDGAKCGNSKLFFRSLVSTY